MPRYPVPSQRPEFFRLNTQSPLAQGLVFGSFGQHPGSTFYKDESVYGNHGTLVGYTGAGNLPQDRWGWSDTLKRARLGFSGATDRIDTTYTPRLSSKVSVSCWIRPSSLPQFTCMISSNSAYTYHIGYSLNIYTSTMYFDVGVTGGALCRASGYTATAGTLFHAMGVYDGNNGYLYINGKLINTSTSVPGSVDASTRPLQICYDYFGGQYFNGDLIDPLVSYDDLSPFVGQLADPSNVDLRIGGIPGLLPIRRYYGTGLNTGAALRRRYIASGGN